MLTCYKPHLEGDVTVDARGLVDKLDNGDPGPCDSRHQAAVREPPHEVFVSQC